MRILSPGFTKRGTLTMAPVSSVAGLVTLLAVSPRTPGSALITSSSRKFGSSTETISITEHLLRNGLLIEGFRVHEDVVVAIDIEELPVLVLNAHGIDLFPC